MTASSVPVVAAGSPGEAGAGMRMVRWAYYGLVLCIPLETILLFSDEARRSDEGGFTLSRGLGLLLFGLALINSRRCFRKIPAAFWTLAWYIAACTASQLWIPAEIDPRFRAHQMTMLQMAALFLISANLFSDEGFRAAVFRLHGWWAGLVAAAMLLGMASVNEGRSSITSQNPNVAGGLFALGAVCLAGDPRLFGAKRLPARLVPAVVGILVLILAILKTGSRGALIGFGVGILSLGACAGKTTLARRLLVASAVLGALLLLVAYEFSHGTQAAARLDAAWNRGDTAGRDAIWKAAWGMFQEKPFFGHGAANNLLRLGIQMNSPFRDTHNFFLAVLTQVGLVGALPLIGALFHALWRAWRYGGRTGDGLPFALMAAMIALLMPTTAYHQKILWIVLAGAAACDLEPDRAPADI